MFTNTLVTESSFQQIDEEESKETKKNPFYDVFAVISQWRKERMIDNLHLPIDLIPIIGMFRGYQSSWSNKYHGKHISLPLENPFCAQTHNIGGPTWAGNSIRGRYPLPNSGVHRIGIKIWFPLAPERDKLQTGYFIGIIRSSRPKRNIQTIKMNQKEEKEKEEEKEILSSENIDNYDISLVEKNQKKNHLKQIYGIELRRDKVYRLYNHIFDTSELWNEAKMILAGDVITMDVNMNNQEITFYKNSQRFSSATTTYDMKFATKDMTEELVRHYYWYPIVSVWHTDAQCDLLYDWDET